MALKTDYRIVDDAEDCADILVFASKTEEGDAAVVINQDGSEVCIPKRMLEDLMKALHTLATAK